MDELWNGILELTAQFVIPDWGATIAMLPILVLVVIVIVLVVTFRRLLRAPKARRGKGRLVPQTPADIHMPGPSLSPFVAAIGATLLFLGLVFGGSILVLGAIALVLSLLWWLGESLHLWERDIAPGSMLPAVIHEGPPAGVHMPGPSFRPFLGAVGATAIMLGLVFGGWVLIAGVIVLILTLVGWLIDARKEYVKTEEADHTGHLENIPAPRTPATLLWVIAVVLVAGVVIEAGILPPRDVSAEPGASGQPPASGEPAPSAGGGEGQPSSDPGAAPPPEADAVVTARGVAFVEGSFTAPADTPFTLAFINEDAGTPHNVEIKDPSGGVAYLGEVFAGVETKVYDVPALPAGAYTFICTVHPNMTGTATVE